MLGVLRVDVGAVQVLQMLVVVVQGARLVVRGDVPGVPGGGVPDGRGFVVVLDAEVARGWWRSQRRLTARYAHLADGVVGLVVEVGLAIGRRDGGHVGDAAHLARLAPALLLAGLLVGEGEDLLVLGVRTGGAVVRVGEPDGAFSTVLEVVADRAGLLCRPNLPGFFGPVDY